MRANISKHKTEPSIRMDSTKLSQTMVSDKTLMSVDEVSEFQELDMANLEKSKELLLRLRKVQDKLKARIETCKESERAALKKKSKDISKRVVQI